MFIEMKITGYTHEADIQKLFYALSQVKGVETTVESVPAEANVPAEVNVPAEATEEFRIEVKEALDRDEKEAIKRVRPSRAKPKPAEEEETVRVVTDVDLRMKAKALLDDGKRDKLITALAEFKNGEFPKVSDIKDADSRLEFMVVLEGL